MKTNNEIKELIEAFYEGRTSLEEEIYLCDYFQNEDIDAEFLAEKDYFLQYNSVKKTRISEDFTSRIDQLFNELDRKEKKEKKEKKYRGTFILIGGIAASLIILFFIGYYWNNNSGIDTRLAVADSVHINYNEVLGIGNNYIDTAMITMKSNTQETVRLPRNNKIQNKKTKGVTKKTEAQESKTISTEDYERMAEALQLISSSLSKGQERLNVISESLTQTTEILNKKQY